MSDDEVAALLLPAVQKIREAAARSNASGSGAGKATFKEFTVTKKTDASAVDGSAADLAATGDDEAIALLLPAIQKVREAAARASAGGGQAMSLRMYGTDTDGDGLGDQFSGRVVIPVVPAGRPEAGPPAALLLLSGGDSGKLTKADAGRSASTISSGELVLKMSDPDAVSLLDASISMLAKGGKKGDKLSLVGFGSFATGKSASGEAADDAGEVGMQVLLLEADLDGDGREETIGSVACLTTMAKQPRPHTQGHVQVGGAALTVVGDTDGDGDLEEIEIDLSGSPAGNGDGSSMPNAHLIPGKDIKLKDKLPSSNGDEPGTSTGGGSTSGGTAGNPNIGTGTTTVPGPFPCKGCRMSGGGGAIGDLDGDGYPDALVADLDGDGIGEDMLLLPDGGGMVADLDGDGAPDLLLSGAMLRRWSEQNENALRNGVATGAGAAAGGAAFDSRPGSGVLKQYFQTGDVPTEEQFGDLIDSFLAPGGGGIIEADTDGDGEWETLRGIAIGDLDGDGVMDYVVTARERGSGMATGRRNQEQDNQDIADKTNADEAAGIFSPRDHQSGLPSGARQHLMLDLSGDGVGMDYEVTVLGDVDGDGLDDYALDKNTQFDIELTVGKGRGMETADEGSSTPSGGADEYKNGDDPITHKRAGKAKYKNIVLKRGMVSDNAEQDTELSWAEADIDGDGETEQLLLSDTSGAFDPDSWQKAYNSGKVTVRGWDPEKKELYTEQADGLIWSPRSNVSAERFAHRQEFGQIQAEKKRCSLVLPAGDLDGDGLEDMIAFGDPPGGQGTNAKGGKEVDKLKEEVKKLTKKESQGTALLDDSGAGDQPGDDAAPEMRAEQTKKMTIKERFAAAADTDDDGLPDFLDDDDDGDGIDELLLGDLDGDGIAETGVAVGDVDGDGLGDYMVLGGNVGINEKTPDTALGRKILDRGEAGDNVALRGRHETAKNSIGNIRGIIAPNDGGAGEASGEGFFKSISGLSMESEVVEFAEGGLRGGKEVDSAWESVSGGEMIIERQSPPAAGGPQVKVFDGSSGMAAGGVYVASGDVNGDGAAETVASLSLSAGLVAVLDGAGEIIIEADTDGDGEWEPLSGLMVGAVMSGGAGGEFDVYAPGDSAQQQKKKAKFKAGAELAGSVNKSASGGSGETNTHGDPHTDTDEWDIAAGQDGGGDGSAKNKVEHWGDPHENMNGRIIEADLDGDGEWEPLDSIVIEADVTGDGVDDPLLGVGIGDVDGDGAPDYSVKLINPVAMDKGLRFDGDAAKFDGDKTPIIKGSALGGLNTDAQRQLGKPKYEDLKILSDEEMVALLLPAVQKIREAAARSSSGPSGTGKTLSADLLGKEDGGIDDLSAGNNEEMIALLLPAVQKIREAAARGSGGGAGKVAVQDISLMSDEEVAALLLPAIQKIREAAARVVSPMAGGGRGSYAIPEVDDEVLIGLLLPAVQKVREAASRQGEAAGDYYVKKHIGNVKYEDIRITADLDGDGEDDGLHISGGIPGDPEALAEKLAELLSPDTGDEDADGGAPAAEKGKKGGKNQQNYLKYELKDILISSFRSSGSGGSTGGSGQQTTGQPQIVENKKAPALIVLGREDVDGDGLLDLLIEGDIDGDGADDLAAYWPHMHQIGTSKREARPGRNPQTGKEIKIAAKSLALGGLDLHPPDGTSEETKAFRARLTDFLGRPNSGLAAKEPDLHTSAHEAAHVIQQRGVAPGGNRIWPKPGYRVAGGTDGGGWAQTSGLAQFDADKIAELYDRLAKGVGQPGDNYEEHADQFTDLLAEAEDLVKQGLELQSQEGGTILQELELLRRHHELCGQTENLRRRVEVLKSNKQGDPDAKRKGSDAPTLEFTSGEPYRMNFELFFDRYEEGQAAEALQEWAGALRASHSYMFRLERGAMGRAGGLPDPVDSSGDVANRAGAPGGSDSGWVDVDAPAMPVLDQNAGVWVDSFDDMTAALNEACQRAYRSRTGNLVVMDDKVERLIPPVQKINDSVGESLEQARLMEEEWERYEAANQTSQMQLLYLQFLKLEKSVLPEVDDEVLLYGDYDSVVGDDCDDDCDGLDELLRPQGLPYEDYESTHRREMGELLRRAIGPDMEPDLYNLIPRTMDSLADLQQAAEQWEELVRILNKVAEDGEPIIGDPEELEDKLNGLLPPGDNPHFEPRLGLQDSDGDGLGDVTELDLGTDPTAPNDEGFIPLISPDDDDSVLYPETPELTFEFEKLESDKIEEYILVLEAEGQIFAIRDADDTEDVQLEQLVGPDGVLAGAIDDNGELHIEWHVEAQLDQSSNIGLPPGAFPNTVSSEHRRLTIVTPVQTEDIILDLSLESPLPIQPKSQFTVRGTISQVDALGRWEIRLAYDPSLLRFVRGERLGMFTSSTVFFGDQPGGVLVISGVAPAGSNGLSGEGAIFDLTFEALDFGEGSIEGDSLELFNIIDVRQEADFGEIVDYVIERVATGASSNGANPNGAPPSGTPGKTGRRGGK